ncbi:MAG: PilX N-terminal domain-containing pilus assembly protein [Halopseudomonas sp.]|uniref:pilus assembly PilX family protein n=1 Tax=Halopseudomonas sp. TaxID=2901191 RepID=UPI0030027190
MYRNRGAQRGAALMVSLVFLLLMSLAALAGVRSATSQERMVANLQQRNQSFQAAEAGVRWVERQIRRNAIPLPANLCQHAPCGGAVPAPDAQAYAASWQALPSAARKSLQLDGAQLWYRLERVGKSAIPVRVGLSSPSTLYRLSVLSLSGNSRTILEATYAHTRL